MTSRVLLVTLKRSDMRTPTFCTIPVYLQYQKYRKVMNLFCHGCSYQVDTYAWYQKMGSGTGTWHGDPKVQSKMSWCAYHIFYFFQFSDRFYLTLWHIQNLEHPLFILARYCQFSLSVWPKMKHFDTFFLKCK